MNRRSFPAAGWVRVRFFATASLLLLVGCASWTDGGDGHRPSAADAATDGAAPDIEVGWEDAAVCDPDSPGPPLALGEIRRDTWRGANVASCTQAEHFVVVSAGQRLEVGFRNLTAPVFVAVVDLHGDVVASRQLGSPEEWVAMTADTTGELRVRVSRAEPGSSLSYETRLRCLDLCELEATRYPVVLVHGAGGADFFPGLDYFFEVGPSLESAGYHVVAPSLTAMGHSEERAQDLAWAVDELLAETGAAQVHLIGHSQAGLDFRVLLGGLGYGDRVATATSIATPHAGFRAAVSSASAWFGMRTDAAYITGEFSSNHPEDPSVPRFSWAAATCGALDGPCLERYDDEVVALALATAYQTLRLAYLDDAYGGDNDGVVPVSAAHWGTFLGILPADHWDVVGQIPLQRLGPFDHLQFYLDEARRLRALELDQGL
ncbi:MAG: alpha/beta fold hydrolase [bacterium]